MRVIRKNICSGVIFAALFASVCQADTWSDRLGFEPGSRVVIFEVRELGVAWEMNAGAAKAIENGVVGSANVVATGPWFKAAAEMARARPDFDWGVSIALTNPHRHLRWRLVSSRESIPDLVNAEGYPWRTAAQLLASASPKSIAVEMEAQINAARVAGINVTHIGGYYGTVYSRPDFTNVLLTASRRHWIPASVVEITEEQILRFRNEGYPIGEEMLQLVHGYSLPKVDDIQLIPPAETFEVKRDLFRRMLHEMPAGLTLVIARPAVHSAGLEQLAPDWQQRVFETELLSDPELKTFLAEEKIITTNWREVMKRFEAGAYFPGDEE